MFRGWAAVTVGLLTVLEIVSLVLLQPLTTFSVSVAEVYAYVSLGGTMVFALFGGLIAASIALVIVFTVDVTSAWSRVNGVALSIGLVLTVFACVAVVVSFSYLALDDAHPEGFVKALPWVTLTNMWVGLPLVAASLFSSAARAIARRRPQLIRA